MIFEEWWEANRPKSSANLILSTYRSWCKLAFEAGQANNQEPEYLTADQLTEHGYYWWLPECFIHEAEKPSRWGVVLVLKDELHMRVGMFSGPIKAPVKRKESCPTTST